MEIFGKSVKMTISMIILVVLIVLLIVTMMIYCRMDNPSGLWGALFGSFAAGLIVAIIQYLIAWQDYIQTEKLKKLKLKEVLYNRTTRSQYEEYIRNTNRRLDLMGVTAVRFFNDFADTSVGAPDNAIVLLQALERGVHVRVLLPTDEFLPEAKRIDSAKVKTKYKELTQRYQNIEIRYFGHTAAHSIFRIDDSCIIGPVFPLLESRNTPALHVMNSSPMALNYLDYFESEWNQAIQEHA